MPNMHVNKILVIGQTPPPYGGQAVMIKLMLEGVYTKADLFHVRMAFSKEMDDIGMFRVGKLFHAVSVVFKVAYLRVRHNLNVLYYPPAGTDYLPVLRDMFILFCVRWMFKKTIFHFHAIGTSELYKQMPFILRIFYRWCFFSPDISIHLTDLSHKDGEYLNASKILMIPNGIQDDYIALGSPSKNMNSVCTILFMGRICETKGIFVLLDAIKILKENAKIVKVNVVGKFASEKLQSEVHDKINEYGLNSYFGFKGVLTGGTKNEQFLNADIFCSPSFFESFGLAVVEAMQFGMPVVVTNWQGVQSIVNNGENGFVVPLHCSQSLADKIIYLIDNPEIRIEMGKKGREMFLQKFTLDKFYQQMDECFANV